MASSWAGGWPAAALSMREAAVAPAALSRLRSVSLGSGECRGRGGEGACTGHTKVVPSGGAHCGTGSSQAAAAASSSSSERPHPSAQPASR